MPNKKFWEVKAKAPKVGELLLYGDICSSELWGDEITPKKIDAELKNLGEMDTLNIYVNSGGGSVFAGMAIYNIIKRCNAKIKNAYVDGIAGSISSVIPLAADKVYMPANSMMMVHNPSGIAMGTADDMRKMADTLEKVKDTIIEVYAEKTGKEPKELAKMMDKETWMTADEAMQMGFADELQDDIKISASVNEAFLMLNNQKFALENFKNAPDFKEILKIDDENRADPPEPVSHIEPEEPQKPDLLAQNEQFKKLKIKVLGGMI